MSFPSRPLVGDFSLAARLLAAALLAGCGLSARAQVRPTAVPVERLDPFLITATRTPSAQSALGSVVDSLGADELARRQLSSLAQALGSASLPAFSSGQPGASTAIFLRGANSNQTLFLVDGLRFNDPNTDYAVFLGGACVSACDSLEVAHGPQSTLYGGEAVGGVVSLRSLRGTGADRSRLALEAGSFGTLQGALSAQGERGAWAYNVALQGGKTDNDRVNNTFESGNVTARIDRTINERLAVGATVRGFEAEYGSPGTRFSNDLDNTERESNWLGTVFADWRHRDHWSSHVVIGGQHRRFESENPSAGRATQTTLVKNRRAVVDWQSTYDAGQEHRLTAGFTAEDNHTRNTGFGAIDRGQSLLAFFVQDEYTPLPSLHLTAGLRHDDFDTFGRHTTGRGTLAWMALPKRLKFRASYGTAFRSPSFLDLYGTSTFYVGNPSLRPERAKGADAGVDVYFQDPEMVLGVTWFDNRFTDLIVSDFSRSPSSVANVGKATTRGAEVSLAWALPTSTQIRLNYTYLEAENALSGVRLLRRPRHSASVDVGQVFSGGFSAGVGLRVVAQREDIHASTFATIDGEDYSVARVYAAWTVNDRLSVRARIENLLDERYEEIHGFPQLPLGAFAAVEWRW
ncbi:MAG: TonB-dependent receptor [Opitutaceae bacterium]|nr:TonB-dependent receptor [Opitutaceae bacterium]